MAKKLDYASLYTRRKDGRYMATYTGEDGKRHSVYDRDPEKLWHKLNDPRAPEVVTFGRIAEEWQGVHWEIVGYKTAEAYTAPLRRLLDHFGDTSAADITPQAVYAYLNDLGKQKYSRRSVQMHRDILNMIYNRAIVSGAVSVNPCAAVTMPRNLPTGRRELPEDGAIEAVKRSGDVPFGLFALICLYAGLRRGEVLALRYDDIDRARGVIHVTKSIEYLGNNPHIKPPKTKAGERDALLLGVLEKQIPQGSGYIFCRDDGGLLTKTQYRKRWLAYCKAIGYDITAHQLRHGYATILYEAGIPDKDAQELLGHSSITVTRDVYTHIRQSRRAETASKLNAFFDNNFDNTFDNKNQQKPAKTDFDGK